MIDLYNIQVAFDGHLALDGLSLHVGDGTLLGVVGPGGSGKSTMCRVVSGLIRPTMGEVVVNKTNLMTCNRQTLREVQRSIGVQFQNDALFEHMTVCDNVCYPLRRLTDLPLRQLQAKAIEQLAMVGLAEFADRLPNQLSGGQRRRVALARACVTDPALLICDDPTAGLDPVTSRCILDMIAGIRYQTGNTVVVVSSDVAGLMSIASRMAMVWKGKIIEQESAVAFRSSKLKEVSRFLDDARLPFEMEGWA